MTVRSLLQKMRQQLEEAGVDSPALSARLLLENVLGMDHAKLALAMDTAISPEQEATAQALADRRAAGEPVAYICGEREFYGLALAVNPAVLIPRPETEHIVDAVLALYDAACAFTFADLGAGSGALAVALATHRPDSWGIAVDVSWPALETASANAARHGVENQVQCVLADFGCLPVPPASLDVIVANPPYIPAQEHAALSREVKAYEPSLALTPGPTGLEAAQKIVPEAGRTLKPGGRLFMESAWDQAESIAALLSAVQCFGRAHVLRDYGGRDRVTVCKRLS